MPDPDRGAIALFYEAIAGRYDLINGFLTLGLDGLWRRKAVSFIPAAAPLRCLDVCCGTGSLSALLAGRLPPGSSVTGADFSPAMLARAKERLPSLLFVRAGASDLPFPDNSFDAVTVSLATRNLAAAPEGLRPCLREFLRVLAPGGLFVQLESSVPPSALTRFFFGLYVKAVTGAAARLLPGAARDAYRFLGTTVLSFAGAEKISEELSAAGFSQARFERLFFGAAAVHTARKPLD